eukprot:symbB.v1.2.002591.t1/scaffold135.1/size305288/11
MTTDFHIQETLDLSFKRNEQTIILSHVVLFPEATPGGNGLTLLWNYEKVLEVFRNAKRPPTAVLCGHAHLMVNSVDEASGTHHVTFPTPLEVQTGCSDACAVVEAFSNGILKIRGRGDVVSSTLSPFLAQRLEGLDGDAAKALVAKEVQKGLDLTTDVAEVLPEALQRHVKVQALEALLIAGAPITPSVQCALLARLADKSNDASNLVKLFVDHGLDVNFADPSPDGGGRTLLMVAICSGDSSLVEEVLNLNADVSKSDLQQNLPLHVAAAEAQEAAVDLLLQRGASVTSKNGDSQSAVMSARLGSLAPNLRLSKSEGIDGIAGGELI